MKTFFARVAAAVPLAVAFAGLGASAEPILWFSVSSMSAVDDGSGASATVADYVDPGGLQANAARVRVTGNGITEADDVFLTLFYGDEETGEWLSFEGLTEAVFEIGGSMDWQPADMDSFDMSLYSFDLEIGHVDVDDENSEFTRIASASETYDNLVASGHVSFGSVTSTQGQTPWTPTTFSATTVPEPGVPILALTGMAMLFGRRRRAVSR